MSTLTRVRHATQDTAALTGRSLRTSSRDVETLLLAVLLPVFIMATFVLVFGGAIEVGDQYVDYVVPGAILLCAGYGASQTAVAVALDRERGFVDRLRAMPVSASAVLTGHVLASFARNVVSTVLVVVVALLLGFDPVAGLGAWLAAAGVLGLYVLATSWLAALLGLLAGNAESASGFTFLMLFLPYLSSAFVPVTTLPGWLQGFAEHQPVTPVAETLRSLLLGVGEGSPGTAVAWCVAVTVVAAAGCAVGFRRTTA